MPDNEPLRNLWWFWVNDYKFGGRSGVKQAQRTDVFFARMNQSAKQGLVQFEVIMENFESCFRGLARSPALNDLIGATDLLFAAADSRYVKRHDLAVQLMNALHSAEWDGREHRDLLYAPISDLADAIANDQP